jgi:hypothetical protein
MHVPHAMWQGCRLAAAVSMSRRRDPVLPPRVKPIAPTLGHLLGTAQLPPGCFRCPSQVSRRSQGWNRRKSSFLTATSSKERTQLFEARLTLIIAYLEHDPGETGAARAATTSYTSDDITTPAPTEGAPALATPPWDRAAVVALLKAQHQGLWNDQEKTSPGTTAHETCPAMQKCSLSARPPRPASDAPRSSNPHWKCKHHGLPPSPTGPVVPPKDQVRTHVHVRLGHGQRLAEIVAEAEVNQHRRNHVQCLPRRSQVGPC